MATIGVLLLLPLLFLMMETCVRTWLRLRAPDQITPVPRRPQTRPRGQTSLEAAEAAAVHQLLSGQIDAAAYHQRMHELAYIDQLTRGAHS